MTNFFYTIYLLLEIAEVGSAACELATLAVATAAAAPVALTASAANTTMPPTTNAAATEPITIPATAPLLSPEEEELLVLSSLFSEHDTESSLISRTIVDLEFVFSSVTKVNFLVVVSTLQLRVALSEFSALFKLHSASF